MNRKSGLGKGLGALIPAEYSEVAGDGETAVQLEVPIGAVTPNPRQPRTHFDEESLAGLTASITEMGVLQPILVRRADDERFELIAGERRWRAAKRAGLQTIPIVVRDADTDADLLEQALVENLHRTDLNAMEEAAAYQQLIEDFGLTQEQVAKRVGKSRTAVSNTLRLFQLPPAIQALVADDQLTAGHARALLGTPDRAYQSALAQRILRDGLSVRETEEAIRARAGGEEPDAGARDTRSRGSASKSSTGGGGDPAFLELERLLSDELDTRVSISSGAGKGRLVVEFADLADLERIYRSMVRA